MRHPAPNRPRAAVAGSVTGMQWSAQTSDGDWIRDAIDQPWTGTMHDVVPRGFAAYARVFHVPSVQWLPDGPMPTFDAFQAMGWEESSALLAKIVDDPTTWAETAATFGTTLHPLAQWAALVRSTEPDPVQTTGPDGRWFNAPALSLLDPASLSALAGVLAAHTTTPDAGFAGLWEGRGGLVGHMGHGPSRAFAQVVGDVEDPQLARHNRMLGTSFRDRFNEVFRRPTWQEGILSREISEGPRLHLPERAFVLFRGGVAGFTASDWELHVPWRDRIAEGYGAEPSALAPSLLWPGDRAWVMVSEVDFDSTVVGGSPELVAAICRTPGIEALPLPVDADLSWQGDEVNR